MRRSTIPVVLLALLSFFAGLGRGAIADTDEAFYAESAREMVESGDWLTPHFNYEPRFQKPALYYWLTAATYATFGTTEFAARLWSALAGLGLVIVTTVCGRRWFDEETGLLAGAITATNFGYFALARMALPDLPLAFCVSLSIWAALVATLERERHPGRWLLLAAVAAGLGFLMKGPLAVIVPTLVVLPILLIERRSLNLAVADVLVAVLVFVAIATPWYVAMWWLHGWDYLVGFFVGDNFERFATSRFNDPRPWWFYLPVIAGGLLPWTPLSLVWTSPIVLFLLRRRDLGTLDLRLLLWIVLPLVFFTLSIGKQPRYVLPILPPLAMLLASSIIERTREWRSLDGARFRPRRHVAMVIGASLSGAVLTTLGVLLYRARTLFIDVPDTATVIVSFVAGVAGLVVILVSLSRAWRAAPAVLAMSSAVCFAALPYGGLSAADEAPVRAVAGLVRQARGSNEAIGTYKVFVRNLVFYTGVRHTDLIHEEHMADWLSKNPRALIVMPAADAARLQNQGFTFEQVARREYFDDGSIRLGMMLWPDASQHRETVVVVRADREAAP